MTKPNLRTVFCAALVLAAGLSVSACETVPDDFFEGAHIDAFNGGVGVGFRHRY